MFDPRRFRAGNEYRVVVAADGSLRRLEYHVDEDRFLQVRRAAAGGAYHAALVPYEKEQVETLARGSINREQTSLVAALNGSGENVTLAIKMAAVLAGEIDFNTELRLGDRFDVLFEKQYREDQFSSYGDVVAVQFINDGRSVRAFRFTVPGDSEPLYYDDQGALAQAAVPALAVQLRAARHVALLAPPAASRARRPPPALGVDYGAPTGTPVIAVATGTVVSAAAAAGRATWCGCATTTATRRTTCICRRSRRAFGRAPAWCRARRSAASARPAWRRDRTWITGCARTAPS